MDDAFHDPVDIGDGVTVYELDDTYSGMMVVRRCADRAFGAEACGAADTGREALGMAARSSTWCMCGHRRIRRGGNE